MHQLHSADDHEQDVTPTRFTLERLREMACARRESGRRVSQDPATAAQDIVRLHAECSAAPLRWLSTASRYEASGDSSFVTPPPPMAPIRIRSRLRPLHLGRAAAKQPLREEDGSPATCPICLAEFREAGSHEPGLLYVQWTNCCGRADLSLAILNPRTLPLHVVSSLTPHPPTLFSQVPSTSSASRPLLRARYADRCLATGTSARNAKAA